MKSDTQSVVIVSQHYPPDNSGNASRIHDTADQLSDENWDVTVLSPPPAFPHGQFDRSWNWSTKEDIDGKTVYRLWAWQPTTEDPGFVSRLAYYLLFPLHACLWLLIHHRQFDLFITSSPPIFTGGAVLPFGLFSSTPWVVDVRDLWIDASVGLGFITEDGLLEKLSRRYQRLVLATADCLTVTTTELGERLVDQYGVETTKITHIPNGVETDTFQPQTTQREPTIIYTGNVGHAQDLRSCILAMSELIDTNATLRIVGDGDIKPDLERLVDELDLSETVEFTGLVSRDEIPTLLDQSMIGIAPLKSEETLEYAVPTKAYEYMANGLPVVGTGTGEIVTLLENSGGGILVENDPEQLADTFVELLTDRQQRRELGQAGREHVTTHYDREQITKKLSNKLTNLVDQQRSQ